MKRILLAGLLVGQGDAMNQPSTNDIAIQIASLVEKYEASDREEDARFSELVAAYFKKESMELQAQILPHFTQKLKESSEEIDRILLEDDKKRLEDLVHGLITESLEEAFRNQESRYNELKDLADGKLKKAKYALIATAITGLLSVGGTIAGMWFGH